MPSAGASSFTFATFDAPGATSTDAYGINDAGQIVGVFHDAGGKTHGFSRTPGGIFTTIDPPGATETYASGINGAGQIVDKSPDMLPLIGYAA